jgi:formate/nitrite transporter FocA (FNT family)
MSRLSQPILAVIIRAIGCGMIMSTAVQFAREGKFLPLLFGVPLFIYCGFYHSIADTFYYLFSTIKPTLTMFFTLLVTYFGNYLGCSTYKVFIKK